MKIGARIRIFMKWDDPTVFRSEKAIQIDLYFEKFYLGDENKGRYVLNFDFL